MELKFFLKLKLLRSKNKKYNVQFLAYQNVIFGRKSIFFRKKENSKQKFNNIKY
jgi:hypothetical protein